MRLVIMWGLGDGFRMQEEERVRGFESRQTEALFRNSTEAQELTRAASRQVLGPPDGDVFKYLTPRHNFWWGQSSRNVDPLASATTI